VLAATSNLAGAKWRRLLLVTQHFFSSRHFSHCHAWLMTVDDQIIVSLGKAA